MQLHPKRAQNALSVPFGARSLKGSACMMILAFIMKSSATAGSSLDRFALVCVAIVDEWLFRCHHQKVTIVEPSCADVAHFLRIPLFLTCAQPCFLFSHCLIVLLLLWCAFLKNNHQATLLRMAELFLHDLFDMLCKRHTACMAIVHMQFVPVHHIQSSI